MPQRLHHALCPTLHLLAQLCNLASSFCMCTASMSTPPLANSLHVMAHDICSSSWYDEQHLKVNT
eukprot:8643411-Karenia_brevis.AAC.1